MSNVTTIRLLVNRSTRTFHLTNFENRSQNITVASEDENLVSIAVPWADNEAQYKEHRLLIDANDGAIKYAIYQSGPTIWYNTTDNYKESREAPGQWAIGASLKLKIDANFQFSFGLLKG